MVKFAVEDADNWDAGDETTEPEVLGWEDAEQAEADDVGSEYADHDFADGPEDEDEYAERAAAEQLDGAHDARPEGEEPPAKKPQFANVFEWFDGFFRPVIRRKIGDSDSSLSWDARWWAYPEVVARLTALHYAWEEARASDSMSAMSAWWIQHLEPHLRVILDGDTGPMANAKESRDWMGWPVLPVDDVPADVFNYIVNNGEGAEE